ncbi:helix-turn-helix domain-containing protein [Streptomyces sp. NPDC047014]|uniref:helix-turn-helix domain-containing protein n=1 Tax=Streptomyces sp. NPDC047014 TaxID=3155736 RepID=UPI0033C0A6EC
MTRSVDPASSHAPDPSLPAPKERRGLREGAGLTLEQAGAAVGVTASTVRAWEAGRTTPRGRKRHAYAQFLARLKAPEAAEPPPDTASEPVAATAEAPRAAEPPPRTAVPAPPDPAAAAPEESGAAAATGTVTATATATATATLTAEPPGADQILPPAPPPEPAEPAPPVTPVTPDPPAGPPAADPAEAFDALYARAAPALARQAYLLTGRRLLALESVDRAFTQAWDQWPEVAADPDPVGRVRALAYEYALSPWNRLRRTYRHPDRPPVDPADRILLDALLALPVVHRRTVLLYDGVGLDLPDTAAETEATTPATGNRLLHAHADLADRVPELADVPPDKLSAVLRQLLASLRPPFALEPRPAAAVRTGGERRVRRWTRATLSLTAMITMATAYTAATAPTGYEPPMWPGESVTGVPPLAGPQRLTDRSRELHDKLRSDPTAGPSRVVPKLG